MIQSVLIFIDLLAKLEFQNQERKYQVTIFSTNLKCKVYIYQIEIKDCELTYVIVVVYDKRVIKI